MEKPFAKLFGTDGDQVLVKLDQNDDLCPEVRIFFQPKHMGVCSFAVSYEDTDSGWDRAEAEFEKFDEAKVRRLVAGYVENCRYLR